MTTDFSLFMKIVSSECLQNMLCTQIVVFVLFWHSEQFWYTTCSADVASFWKRFTCNTRMFPNLYFASLSIFKFLLQLSTLQTYTMAMQEAYVKRVIEVFNLKPEDLGTNPQYFCEVFEFCEFLTSTTSTTSTTTTTRTTTITTGTGYTFSEALLPLPIKVYIF